MKSRGSIGMRLIARLGAGCAAWACLAAPAAAQTFGGGGRPATETPGVKANQFGTIDLTVQETDLTQVLEMLSIQGRKNIIASKKVSGNVSANLFDVTFYEALDAILRVNGFDWIEEGNFIYVYTQDEIQTIGRTESRIFELEHLSAGDAMEMIKPLLSPNGQASARGDVQPGIEPDTADVGADGYAYNAKLVVNDFTQNIDAIEKLLAELDVSPQQVLVEATILQTTLDESNAFGVDFSLIGEMNFTDLTNPLGAVNNLLAGSDATDGFQPADNKGEGLVSSPGNTGGAGTFKLGIVHEDWSLFVKLLDEVTDTTVLARPKILALNRQRAEVLVGARIGYLSTTSTQTTTTQTVQFLDTGIHLVLRPFISRNGMIRLELAPSVSEASLRTVTDAQNLQVTIPDELTNELTTNVRVRDGQTLVLGGLFRESTRTTRRQVPWIGDIPLLGAAFTGQDDTVDRDEIIFLITPTILRDETLWEIGAELQTYTDAAVLGARAGLLPFSRTAMSMSNNRKAMEAYRDGDLNKALHYISNSLGINPNQPDVLELRGEITGERVRSYDRSLLERAFRSKLGPMPPEKVLLPQEVAMMGGGSTVGLAAGGTGVGGANRWASKEGQQQDWTWNEAPEVKAKTETEAAPKPEPKAKAEPKKAESKKAETKAEAKPAAPASTETTQIPGAAAAPSFWRAGEDPAAYGDPSLRRNGDFVTFDDVIEAAGVTETAADDAAPQP